MSKFLYVSLEDLWSAPPSAEALIAEVREATAPTVPNRLVQKFRLLLREQAFGYSVEPFLGSASFAALLSKARPAEEMRSLLVAVVRACEVHARTVGVAMLVAEPGRCEVWPVPTDGRLVEELLTGSITDGKWMRFQPRLWEFYISGVEARLWQPLPVADHGTAAGFFVDFTVCATSLEEATELVRADLEGEHASLVGTGVPERRILDSGTRDAGVPRVLQRGGRVYFPEDGRGP